MYITNNFSHFILQCSLLGYYLLIGVSHVFLKENFHETTYFSMAYISFAFAR